MPDMIIGAIDTSQGFSCAVASPERILLNYASAAEPRAAARDMAETLKAQLADQGLTVAEIVRWTVGTGPGSFAGIRAGIALLSGICLQTAAQLRGLPSSLALAGKIALLVGPQQTLAVLHDGRQGQLIVTTYRKEESGMKLVREAAAFDPESAIPHLDRCERLVTLHGEAMRRLLPESLTRGKMIEPPSLDAAALLADRTWPADPEALRQSLEPVYVRPAVFVDPRPARP